jgi:hypothetical protein
MADWWFWTKLTTSFIVRILFGLFLIFLGAFLILSLIGAIWGSDVTCSYEHGFYQNGRCNYD